MFSQSGNECKTITIWDSVESVSALNDSFEYKKIVDEIEKSGILYGEHHTEVLDLYGGFVTQQLYVDLPNVRALT
ncbi:MAG: hypothetical protein GWO38_00825 [Phycisphaerae bacterium]|nr:hypothetical protein [Phycisphaerae bacterium]NIP50505.1 hypothetical protein [Phycisphaerae bacterium]NIX26191.1 hypothetical protein [Phycisphaerae bacterium]